MTKGSATVNFDRSFRALSKREDSRPCASAQGRDGKEDEGCEGEGRGKLRGGGIHPHRNLIAANMI